jgi:uncharacterized protein YbaR (Trm112 family)
MDKRLLDILCCPVSHVPLRLLATAELNALNQAISAGEVDNVGGMRVSEPLRAGLIGSDRKVVYRIDDDIPVLLAEEGIGTTQLHGFPGA